jgi:NDP-sugar pyrophosphorylase family protein
MTDDCKVCGCDGFVHRVVSMANSVAGVVLAAGRGERLRPLTTVRPKALCPVDGTPLVDLALRRLEGSVGGVAVNVHHGRALLEAHLAGRVHLSVEERPLGTAGALGQLRPWVDGRPVLVVNGDAWCPGDVGGLVQGWDGERIRVLVVGDDVMRPHSRIAGALMPWADVERLEAVESGLWEVSWRAALDDGRVEVLRHDGPFVDCGTPADYLAANLAASGGRSVIGVGAQVEGELVRSVVWPGAEVRAGEVLIDAVRYDRWRTLLIRGAAVRP